MVKEAEHDIFNEFDYDKVRVGVQAEKSMWRPKFHNMPRLLQNQEALL